jgi:hypothetical protein
MDNLNNVKAGKSPSAKGNNPLITGTHSLEASEDDLFDDIVFSAINPGLGFHEDSKTTVRTPSSPPRSGRPVTSAPKKVKPQTRDLKKAQMSSINRSAGEFYNRSVQRPPALATYASSYESSLDESPAKKVINAGNDLKVCAYLMDLFVIGLILALSYVAFLYVDDLKSVDILRYLSKQDMYLVGTSMFSLYYLIYFTLLDLYQTPGKKYFGIQVRSIDGGSSSIRITLVRSVVGICSFFLLFLPLVFESHDYFSRSKVVIKNV